METRFHISGKFVRRRSQRTDWRKERKLNSETFGVASTRRGGFRGRGYYRGMGGIYRGGGGNAGPMGLGAQGMGPGGPGGYRGGHRGHRGMGNRNPQGNHQQQMQANQNRANNEQSSSSANQQQQNSTGRLVTGTA